MVRFTSGTAVRQLAVFAYICIRGTLLGAGWALAVLVASALWLDAAMPPSDWLAVVDQRAQFGLWFGAVAGALIALAGAGWRIAPTRGRSAPSDWWLLMGSATMVVIVVVIGSWTYRLIRPELIQTRLSIVGSNIHWVAAICFLLLLAAPAMALLLWLSDTNSRIRAEVRGIADGSISTRGSTERVAQ